MMKIKLNKLNSDDMRVLAWLLRQEVINPVEFDLNGINSKEFLINQILINLFCRRFNKMVFENKKHSVALTWVETVSLLQKILEVEVSKDIELSAYARPVLIRVKLCLHESLAGLPVLESLPF